MKRFFLLTCVILLGILTTQAQQLSGPSAAVESGTYFTVKATGESSSSRFVNFLSYGGIYSTANAGDMGGISVLGIKDNHIYIANSVPLQVTSSQMAISNYTGHNVSVQITLSSYYTYNGGNQDTPVDVNFTVTVKPDPSSVGTVITGPYVYHNGYMNKFVNKNNCTGPWESGSSINVEIRANDSRFDSTIGVDDANNKARNYLNANAQNIANSSGSCSNPSIEGYGTGYTTQQYVLNIANFPPGVTFSWTVETGRAVINSGQGTSSLYVTPTSNNSGTQNYPYYVTCTITKPNGDTYFVDFSAPSYNCPDCPID